MQQYNYPTIIYFGEGSIVALGEKLKGENLKRILFVTDKTLNDLGIVKEVLGSKYLKNLNSINEAVKILNKKENRLVSSQAVKATIQAVRAGVAPPLTQRGRLLTAILTLHNKEAQKRAADSLLDEVAMKNVAELLEHSAHTRRFFEKAFSLGFAIPDEESED